MFRAMRRKKKEIDIKAAEALLQTCRRGILAVNGDNGYPYAIPLNYVYDKEALKNLFSRSAHGTQG